ncbi:hypothetical protein GLAREA_10817 [Glarea lozoyensis ATCC 20868]|nr:uncharacterized protein GLAREA_10817 [Glarea lozoyensis ATCC 20868]EPE35121.1 hypothetical protein GLAREA_10817 [Glarea lozoyensis ATCC 20868]
MPVVKKEIPVKEEVTIKKEPSPELGYYAFFDNNTGIKEEVASKEEVTIKKEPSPEPEYHTFNAGPPTIEEEPTTPIKREPSTDRESSTDSEASTIILPPTDKKSRFPSPGPFKITKTLTKTRVTSYKNDELVESIEKDGYDDYKIGTFRFIQTRTVLRRYPCGAVIVKKHARFAKLTHY